jgi:hypothetical protein
MRVILVALGLFTGIAVMPNGAAAQEREEQGTSTVAGVQISVKADSWQGWPAHLTEVIPLLVSIENRGSAAVRLRYEDFRLAPAAGIPRVALPPFDIRAAETAVVGTTGFARYPYTINGFFVAPHLAPYYPYIDPFTGAFVYDPFYYTTYYPAFARIPLPTRDMVAKALPEGVLRPGGRIEGFLYFDEGFDSERATFQLDLVDAETSRQLGMAAIPLEID